MIIDCVTYRDGKAHPNDPSTGSLADATKDLGHHDFVWVALQDPTYAEFSALEETFGLHPLAVEDAVTAHQRPKVDVYESSAFVVLRALEYDQSTNEVVTSEVSMFVGDTYVIVARHGTWPRLAEVRDRIDAHPDMLRHGSVAAAYHVVDTVVDSYQEVEKELTEDVEEVESAVFSQQSAAATTRVYLLKRELVEFRRAVGPIRDPLERVLHGKSNVALDDGLLPYFRDVADHLVHTRSTIESLDSLLDNVMQARATQISVQQNDDMRKLAAYAAMFAAPTLVAGVYGMNFDHMSELHWTFGYPLALGLMVVGVLVLWRLFKRSGWL